jgi:hypothetical protein
VQFHNVFFIFLIVLLLYQMTGKQFFQDGTPSNGEGLHPFEIPSGLINVKGVVSELSIEMLVGIVAKQ